MGDPTVYLKKMRALMVACAPLLEAKGYEDKAKEMLGSAAILLTWIEGLAHDAEIEKNKEEIK